MESHYMKGVGKLDDRLIILLDLERIFDGTLRADLDMANLG